MTTPSRIILSDMADGAATQVTISSDCVRVNDSNVDRAALAEFARQVLAALGEPVLDAADAWQSGAEWMRLIVEASFPNRKKLECVAANYVKEVR